MKEPTPPPTRIPPSGRRPPWDAPMRFGAGDDGGLFSTETRADGEAQGPSSRRCGGWLPAGEQLSPARPAAPFHKDPRQACRMAEVPAIRVDMMAPSMGATEPAAQARGWTPGGGELGWSRLAGDRDGLTVIVPTQALSGRVSGCCQTALSPLAHRFSRVSRTLKGTLHRPKSPSWKKGAVKGCGDSTRWNSSCLGSFSSPVFSVIAIRIYPCTPVLFSFLRVYRSSGRTVGKIARGDKRPRAR